MELDRGPQSEESLRFLILGQRVRVRCRDPELRQQLIVHFGAMATANDNAAPDLEYSIGSGTSPRTFSLLREGQALGEGDDAELLYLLEKDFTVEVQRRRPDLLFLHSAVVEWGGKACLLAAESGGGKSTTTWALLHHNFRYLSDELGPIDPRSLRVFPYPHALCLKRSPGAAYRLPEDSLERGRTIHIPTRSLPSATVSGARQIGAVFLVAHRPELSDPNIRVVSSAEATARLYVVTLNALAHPNRGLDAVMRISTAVPCFDVSCAELAATSALICSTAEEVIARGNAVADPP